MKRLLQMPLRESDFDEFSDTDSRVIECQEVTPPHIPLGWFLVIMAVDIACLVAIYAGIAKALHR